MGEGGISTHKSFPLPSTLQTDLNSFVTWHSSAPYALIALILSSDCSTSSGQHKVTHILLQSRPRDSFLGQTVWGVLSCVSGFSGSSAGKESRLQCRRPWFDSWVGKIPWKRERLSPPVLWHGELHGGVYHWVIGPSALQLPSGKGVPFSLSLPVPPAISRGEWKLGVCSSWSIGPWETVLSALALGKASVNQEKPVVGLVRFCGTRQVISEVIRETHGPLQRGKRKGLLAIEGRVPRDPC